MSEMIFKKLAIKLMRHPYFENHKETLAEVHDELIRIDAKAGNKAGGIPLKEYNFAIGALLRNPETYPDPISTLKSDFTFKAKYFTLPETDREEGIKKNYRRKKQNAEEGWNKNQYEFEQAQQWFDSLSSEIQRSIFAEIVDWCCTITRNLPSFQQLREDPFSTGLGKLMLISKKRFYTDKDYQEFAIAYDKKYGG